ncbi:hypothetical protein EVAR_39200_1 [Eumeta japonica]|uniref:Uncharacterized protein n=1 Tax=Eumeta variegata TaxID=151549 RepID=A0A4C1VNI5_EUMVA|nr:hypothetical protein EVAR_39200_1 [Eumeta japonica]
MSTSSSNITQSLYSPSDAETSQAITTARLQNFKPSLCSTIEMIEESDPIIRSHIEAHRKRLEALRKELDYIKSTEWEFENDKGFLQ